MLLLIATALAEAPGDAIAEVAAEYLDEKPALRIEACNGLIEDVLLDAGYPMRGRVTTLYAQMDERGWVHHEQLPFPGDIVFFDYTYDSNKDGRANDRLSHIAIVIDVDVDGTVHMVHRASSGIKPLTMNLRHPSQHMRNGKVINSFLAARNYGKEGRQLAGELWRAFATVEGDEDEPVVAAAEPIQRETRPPRTRRTRAKDAVTLVRPPRVTRRIRDGRALRPRHLDRLDCDELWYLRNAVFARHGYAFTSPEALAHFATEEWYWRNEDVNAKTAHAWLTETDRQNVALIQEFERHCPN